MYMDCQTKVYLSSRKAMLEQPAFGRRCFISIACTSRPIKLGTVAWWPISLG